MKPDFNKIRNKYFPKKLVIDNQDYFIEISNEKDVYKIFDQLSPEVFSKERHFPRFNLPVDRKEKAFALIQEYQKLHHEWFLFKNSNKEIVGWFMGEADDFNTFYMRNGGILPAYQNINIYSQFFSVFENYLFELGYEKMSSQHQVTNKKILIKQLKLGFIPVNIELTDNWGPLLKMVKFLNADRNQHFINLYGDKNHSDFF